MNRAIKKYKKTKKGVSSDLYTLENVKIATYYSMSEAHRQTGTTIKGISLCCSGKRGYSNGYKWKKGVI